MAPGEGIAYFRAAWELATDLNVHIEAVHRLSDLGAVVTHAGHGTSRDGFEAEWRAVDIMTVDGDLINRVELFDEADIEAALARFDELNQQVPQLENAATRTWARVADAFNRRDVDDFVALTSPDGRLDDRRTGVRDVQDESMRRRVVQTLFEYPTSWRLEIEHLAIRGPRLCMTRQILRDTNEADRPITIELLTVLEVGDDGLARDFIHFDPDDFNGATAELTARWIASGDVAHPEVIETARRLNESVNRQHWEAFAALNADATFVDHRQLSRPGVRTFADHMPSLRAAASLLPTHRVEVAEILAHSASGLVAHMVLKGTSAEGFAIELPIVTLFLLDGERVTHVENFDLDQRDLALARFEDLRQRG